MNYFIFPLLESILSLPTFSNLFFVKKIKNETKNIKNIIIDKVTTKLKYSKNIMMLKFKTVSTMISNKFWTNEKKESISDVRFLIRSDDFFLLKKK